MKQGIARNYYFIGVLKRQLKTDFHKYSLHKCIAPIYVTTFVNLLKLKEQVLSTRFFYFKHINKKNLIFYKKPIKLNNFFFSNNYYIQNIYEFMSFNNCYLNDSYFNLELYDSFQLLPRIQKSMLPEDYIDQHIFHYNKYIYYNEISHEEIKISITHRITNYYFQLFIKLFHLIKLYYYNLLNCVGIIEHIYH
jgi:hypothetical protein